MVDNDNACEPDKRGVLESIASKLAPTVSRDCVKNPKNTRSMAGRLGATRGSLTNKKGPTFGEPFQTAR